MEQRPGITELCQEWGYRYERSRAPVHMSSALIIREIYATNCTHHRIYVIKGCSHFAIKGLRQPVMVITG